MVGREDGKAAGILFPLAHLGVHCARNVPGLLSTFGAGSLTARCLELQPVTNAVRGRVEPWDDERLILQDSRSNKS